MHPLRSFLNLANAESNGLSCMLFPFLPRRPQRLASVSSTPTAPLTIRSDCLYPAAELLSLALGTLPLSLPLGMADPPPRIAETDEWAHRACFLIAEVTVMHSVVIKATGSTAMDILVSQEGKMCISGLWSWSFIRAGNSTAGRLLAVRGGTELPDIPLPRGFRTPSFPSMVLVTPGLYAGFSRKPILLNCGFSAKRLTAPVDRPNTTHIEKRHDIVVENGRSGFEKLKATANSE